MRVLYGIIVFFALFLLACSDAEREEKRLEGNLLMKGDSGNKKKGGTPKGRNGRAPKKK